MRGNIALYTEWRDKHAATGWWHSFELPDGSLIEGACDLAGLRRRLGRLPVPESLAGKRVLDIGAWDGWFSFEMERRGAEVVAVDCWRNERLLQMKSALGSRVDYRVLDVSELSPETLGTFDLVLCLGVVYHLKHPLLGLERVCAVTRDTAIVESFIIGGDGPPVAEFYETDEFGGQNDNWSGPNLACLLAWCRTAGFARVEHVATHEHGAVVVCRRRFEEPASDRPAVQLTRVMHVWNSGVNFRSGADEYVAAFFECDAPATRDSVRPEVSGYGVIPLVVASGNGLVQANFRLPPGLEPGWHEVTVRAGAGPRSNPQRIAVDLPVRAERLEIAGLCDGTTWQPGVLDRSRGDVLSIWVRGLPENADVANTAVLIGGSEARVLAVVGGQVNCSVAGMAGAGEQEVTVRCGEAVSPPAAVVIY
jgi:tRNA (mo5U34)-methyltransferase